jgi:asparagine synthase (glutamine-hydrolysing)
MCGIAGAVGSLTPRLIEAVRAASDRQTVRGPDSSGEWPAIPEPGAGAFFAFRRLKIIDLSPLSDQPMVDPETGNVLVFNGEIYNFKELRAELERLGHSFRSSGDSEVLLRAYSTWGDACLPRLRGMFAFAIWDARERRALLARDRLGIKPLYYAALPQSGGGVAVLFASQVRSLLASGLIERRLDETGLATFLWNGFVVGPGTIIRGIRQLAAGSSLCIDGRTGQGAEQRYWDQPAPASGVGNEECLRDTLQDAVRQHLVSDVPLGIFLSGGRDSSAIAAVASRVAPGRIRTFTIGFEEARYDEARHAREIAARLGTEHDEVPLSERTFRDRLEDALHCIDQPTFDAINSYFVSRAVREAGLTVAMAGTGGDELFGGYRTFRDLPRLSRWSRRFAPVPDWAAAPAAKAFARATAGFRARVPPQTRWGKLSDALAARGDLTDLYQVSYALFTRDFRRRLSLNGLAVAADHGLPAGRAAELRALVSGRSPLSAISALEMELFLGERLLRDTDAASMEVSLEVRVPLLDHRVVEAVCALDDGDRFEPIMRKSLLHRVAMPQLPESLFDRPKSGFELPLEVWCRRGLRPLVAQTLTSASACEAAHLDPGVVRDLWGEYERRAPGLHWSRVWALFVLLWWCREHRVCG